MHLWNTYSLSSSLISSVNKNYSWPIETYTLAGKRHVNKQVQSQMSASDSATGKIKHGGMARLLMVIS